MDAAEINAHWRRVPFEPFTLVMANDERYDVRHRGMLVVGRTDLAYGASYSENPDEIPYQIIPLSTEYVARIEPSLKNKFQTGNS